MAPHGAAGKSPNPEPGDQRRVGPCDGWYQAASPGRFGEGIFYSSGRAPTWTHARSSGVSRRLSDSRASRVTLGPIQVALQVAAALETCGLRYLVGGSVASSINGEPRTTLDVDMVVAMAETDVGRFLAALGPEFYADDETIRRAIRQHSCVNLIHQPSAIKVDLFIAGGSPLDEQQIGRRRRVQVSENPNQYLYVHTRKTSCCKSSDGSASGRKFQIDSGETYWAFSWSKERRSIATISVAAPKCWALRTFWPAPCKLSTPAINGESSA